MPPLSLVTVLHQRQLRRPMSLLLIVQVADWPRPTVIESPVWLPPVQTMRPPCSPEGPLVSASV